MNDLVAIVGRPNVGKSTLFNRLTESRQAIVSDMPGTTRDRQYGRVLWNGKEFSLVDTGGWIVNSDDVLEGEINKQVMVAIEEADAILFVVDVKQGVTNLDDRIADMLRRSNKRVIVVANKCDNYEIGYQSAEFYSLGLGDPYPISSINGSGTGELLDFLISMLPKENKEDELDNLPKFAITGRPNVGKSSLTNALLGEECSIVTNTAGTTRDAIFHKYNKFGMNFYLIDTAGIRQKTKVKEELEYLSIIRSIRAIENCDVCILMLDAERGIEKSDLNIFSIIQKNKKGMIVMVNKWDLIENKSNQQIKSYEETIRLKLAPFTDFPIVFGSALTKQRILKVIDLAKEVYYNRKRKIPTSKLNEVMLPIIEKRPPTLYRGREVKIKYITQLPNTHIPSFIFFSNASKSINEQYKRFLENRIRENWNFSGTPINIFFREKNN